MAQRHDEKCWRAPTRIEVDLPAEMFTALDVLAMARGVSRTDVVDTRKGTI